jgi:hypothetical protein
VTTLPLTVTLPVAAPTPGPDSWSTLDPLMKSWRLPGVRPDHWNVTSHVPSTSHPPLEEPPELLEGPMPPLDEAPP